jgi:hypothetical protein
MYFVYDLRRDGFVVYTGLTTDPGRSLSRHLAAGRRFDSLHLVEKLPRLEDARFAAQRRRDRQSPVRGTRARSPGGVQPGNMATRRQAPPPPSGAYGRR